jgi:hypothetical protein
LQAAGKRALDDGAIILAANTDGLPENAGEVLVVLLAEDTILVEVSERLAEQPAFPYIFAMQVKPDGNGIATLEGILDTFNGLIAQL